MLSSATVMAHAAIERSAERNLSTYLPYCAEFAEVLSAECATERRYTDALQQEWCEYHGESDAGPWRVVLRVAYVQPAQYR